MTARGLFYRPDGLLRAPWRLAGYVLVLAGAASALTALAGVVALRMGAGISTTSPGWQLVSVTALLAATWFAHVVMLRWVDRRPWSSVGLGRSQLTARRLGAGFAAGALGIGVPSLILLGVDWLRAMPGGGGIDDSWWAYAAFMLVFFLPQALGEEMLIRGYPFAVLRESIGWKGALLVTSAVFGVLHLANPGADVQSLVLVALAGVFLGGVLLATDSLYAAWAAHFGWNWVMAALLHTAVSGIPMRAPDYQVVDNGPDWATGGPWGPEGGAGAAVGMLVALWLIVAWRQRRATPTHARNERHD